MLPASVFDMKRLKMNRENYKKDRNSPKVNRKISRAKGQMLAIHAGIHATSVPKLRENYSAKTQWLTNVIPKVKE
jgi:hypothetical protein